mgnify:CR=1 FL=1
MSGEFWDLMNRVWYKYAWLWAKRELSKAVWATLSMMIYVAGWCVGIVKVNKEIKGSELEGVLSFGVI